MTSIPEDIRAKAEDFAERLSRPHSTTKGNAIRLFEKALMEERERCAKIAIALTRETVTDDDHIMRVAVAAAIRTTGSIVAAAILDPTP